MPTPHVNTHVRCVQCGYNLFGTAWQARCPECGLPVAESVVDVETSEAIDFASYRRLTWWLCVNVLVAGLCPISCFFALVVESRVGAAAMAVVFAAYVLSLVAAERALDHVLRRSDDEAARQVRVRWPVFGLMGMILVAGLFALNAAAYAYFKRHSLSDATSRSTEYMVPVGVGLLLLLGVAWRSARFGQRQAMAARLVHLFAYSRKLRRLGTLKAWFETVWLVFGVATFLPIVFRLAFEKSPVVFIPFLLCGVGFVAHIAIWIYAVQLHMLFAEAVRDRQRGDPRLQVK